MTSPFVVEVLPLFPLYRLLRSDGGSHEPDVTPVDYYYYPEGAYYYVETTDGQE